MDIRAISEGLGGVVLLTVSVLLFLAVRRASRNRVAREQLDAIFHTIPDAVMINRLSDGSFLEINAGFLVLSGYERPEVIGRSSLEINVWAHVEDRQKVLDHLARDKKLENLPVVFRRKGGTTFLGMLSSRILTLLGETYILSVVHDMTDRDRAEAALRESEQRYRLLADYANDVIWTMSLEGRFTYVSPSVLGLRGYTPEEVLNQSLEEAICSGSIALVQAGIQRVFSATEEAGRLPTEYIEIEQPCKDGTTVWTEVTVGVMFGADRKPVGVVGVTRDISERKSLEHELYLKATTDSLTGATNRYRFLELAEVEFKRGKRRTGSLALALIDVDRFKQINDSLGHSAGDKALVAVTQICQRNIRDIDVFARFGGDEFVLLFPDTTKEQARVVLERIQADLGGTSAPFTISAGIATLTDAMNGLDRLLERADLLLYQAKEQGRNRVVLDPEIEPLATS